MIRYFKGTLLAAVSIAFAGVAMAENPPATSQQQTTDQQATSPASASSPHQRDSAHEQANEATPTASAPTSDTDPSASSTKHQRETTRTAKSKTERDQMMKDCVEQAQARDSSMSMDQATKSCKDQMKSSSERTGGG